MAIVGGSKQDLLTVLVCLLSLQAALVESFRAESCQFASKRLPTHIQPERYQVVLDARNDKKLLHGKVRIHLNIGELGTDPFTPDTEIPDEIVAPDWDFSETSPASPVASKLLPLKKRRLVKRATGESSRQASKRPIGNDSASRGIQPAQNQIVINSIDKLRYWELNYYATISDGGSIRRRKVEIKNTCFDLASSILVITLAENLEPGTRGQLDIGFSGDYRQLKKAYCSFDSRAPKTGQRCDLFSNRLKEQPTEPAFPSFHEPAFRSIFEMSIIVDAKESGYSTMPMQSEHLLPRGPQIGFDSDDDDFYSHERAQGNISVERGLAIEPSLRSYRKVVRFQKTPLMPIYLVGVASGDFRKSSCTSRSGLPISLMVQPDSHEGLDQFMLDMARQAVDLVENLFGQPYPVPKLDIMTSFDHNSAFVGLIKIRRRTLYTLDGKLISAQLRGVAVEMLVRGIASNYINMYLPKKWWSDNWFRGVLTFVISGKHTASLVPSYDRMLGIHEFTTLTKDSEGLERYQNNDLNEMYLGKELLEKMLALLEGIEEVVPNLIIGHVTQLMKSDQPKLMNANQIFAGLPPFVQAYIFDWVRTKGYPVVTINQIERKALAIRQERAVLLDTDINQLDGHKWPLLLELLVYRDDNQEPESIKLTWSGQGSQLRVQLPDWFDPYEGHWYIVKKNMGYHRIRYGSDSLDIIRLNSKSSQMRAIDRRLIVDDAIGLLQIGYINAIDLIHTIVMFTKEQDLHVVNNLVRGVTLLKRLYPAESTRDRLGWFACGMFQHLFEHYGLGPQPDLLDDELASLAAAYDMLVASGSEPIIGTLIDMYRSDPTGWKQGRVAEHIREPMLAAVAKHGTDREFTDLLKEFELGPDASMLVLRSLATAASSSYRIKQLIVDIFARRPSFACNNVSQKFDSIVYRLMERILVLGFEADRYVDFLAIVDKTAQDKVSKSLALKEVGYYPSVASYATKHQATSNPTDKRARQEANSYRVRQLNLDVEPLLVALLTDLAARNPSS